jgi:hypothetical protein
MTSAHQIYDQYALHSVLTDRKGQLELKHDNGELSQVTIELAGMGMRKIRIANLPPEVNGRMTKNNLVKYGDVKEEQLT